MGDLATLMHQCAPSVAPTVLEAIMRTESHFDPLALHINNNVRLRRPPQSAAQAADWSGWLIKRGYSVDLGLMQINSRNLGSLHLTPQSAFDPCETIRAGAELLKAQYTRARQTGSLAGTALLQAISAYNTGNFHSGFRNGYVARVMLNNSPARELLTLDMSCLLTRCAKTADTAVGGVWTLR